MRSSLYTPLQSDRESKLRGFVDNLGLEGAVDAAAGAGAVTSRGRVSRGRLASTPELVSVDVPPAPSPAAVSAAFAQGAQGSAQMWESFLASGNVSGLRDEVRLCSRCKGRTDRGNGRSTAVGWTGQTASNRYVCPLQVPYSGSGLLHGGRSGMPSGAGLVGPQNEGAAPGFARFCASLLIADKWQAFPMAPPALLVCVWSWSLGIATCALLLQIRSQRWCQQARPRRGHWKGWTGGGPGWTLERCSSTQIG
jgi:hypothetical protein